ncbi:hypothetical protein GCM10010464_31140 [Pseudonocardia yunnanensis]|uniref:Uncharacterized protein n=1 Tax=Pseudonocardia yunnanensis TaxID=58107 RepID=A0ABW4ESF3_9PSEU
MSTFNEVGGPLLRKKRRLADEKLPVTEVARRGQLFELGWAYEPS